MNHPNADSSHARFRWNTIPLSLAAVLMCCPLAAAQENQAAPASAPQVSAAPAAGSADAGNAAAGRLVRIASNTLRLGFDRSSGALRELAELPDAANLLDDNEEPFALWKIQIVDGETTQELAADQLGPPEIQSQPNAKALRMTWTCRTPASQQPMRVEVEVRLDDQGTAVSHWALTIHKPRATRLTEVACPRIAGLDLGDEQALAVPVRMGSLSHSPQALLRGPDGKGRRLMWSYPNTLSLQCLAYYQPDGPGLYVASDDVEAYAKMFALWGDGNDRIHFEMTHAPEWNAADTDVFRLPYAPIIGAFHGDWSTAAQRYRESPASRVMADRGRLRSGRTPAWVHETGLWVWNRGRSPGVLPPAAILQEHLRTPVSVFWHWWHGCAYDVGFPEYLPPREGAAAFRAAMDASHEHGVHAIVYMNQALWGTTTASWTDEGAEAYATKRPDGSVYTHTFCTFMPAPCATMCMGTEFWRNKYSGLTHEAIGDLHVDGIYMDMACMTPPCYDPNHGHPLGTGRFWTEGFGRLATAIRESRGDARNSVALAGEYCGEPWLPHLDLMLNLQVSEERYTAPIPSWETIPFFPAVYNGSTICYGNYSSLVSPPYDEKWPAENAPPNPLSLLDRKFARQFRLEQARTFVWGQQPMLANFLPNQIDERPEEIDYVTRLARTRHRGLKYLLRGTWLRPPAIDAPQREIDIVKVGIYTGMSTSSASRPAVLASAWRAPDGDVGIALASIDDEALNLRVPIDVQGYGLGERRHIYRIDATGRHRIGQLDVPDPVLKLELPPQAVWILEFCQE
ncbi:MAG: hypothetical protein JXA69_07745 [Phycisphaerae bacterium]|nr:hypothetical protein [Phycisphaerae bacterium]